MRATIGSKKEPRTDPIPANRGVFQYDVSLALPAGPPAIDWNEISQPTPRVTPDHKSLSRRSENIPSGS